MDSLNNVISSPAQNNTMSSARFTPSELEFLKMVDDFLIRPSNVILRRLRSFVYFLRFQDAVGHRT